MNRVTNNIKLQLSRFIDEDYECNNSVLTILIDNNNMYQYTGMEAEAIYSCVKDLVQPGEDIDFEEEDDGR